MGRIRITIRKKIEIQGEKAKKRYTYDYCRECNKKIKSNLLKNCKNCFQHCLCSSCLKKCLVCDKMICNACECECNECGDKMCEDHLEQCDGCGVFLCHECIDQSCTECGNEYCRLCTSKMFCCHCDLTMCEDCNKFKKDCCK